GRRVHGREGAHRAVRGGGWGHAVSRRAGEYFWHWAGEAASRAADGGVRAARLERYAQDARARDRGDQREPAAGDSRGQVSGRLVLPAQRDRARGAGARGSARGYSAAGAVVPGEGFH